MKKFVTKLFAIVIVWTAFFMTAKADELQGNDDWQVEFSQEKEMLANFSTQSFADVLDSMQPGDSAAFAVTIKNSYEKTTDWYMTNRVLQSLEDASKTASGGAYSYALTYTDADNQILTIYNSDAVGGENAVESLQGLHEATSAVEDYFYLDTLEAGESGLVQIYVKLDGETQGNDYQDTLARLQLNFAVELPEPVKNGEKTVYDKRSRVINAHKTEQDEDVYVTDIIDEDTPTINTPDLKIVKTGDNTNLLFLFVVALILGILLLLLGIYGWKLRKKIKQTGVSVLIFALLLSAVLPFESRAATYFADDYTYTVRIFSGAQGVFSDGSSQITIEAAPDTKLDFSKLLEGIQLNSSQDALGNIVESKYYAKGIRESGKDNNTVETMISPVYQVTRDIDLVVAYAMKGNDVAYTVNYVSAQTGEELLQSETFYGNIGEKPVVAYRYISGYEPQAYNLTKSLQEDASQNVFTFTYSYTGKGQGYYELIDGGIVYIDELGETIVDHIPGNVIHIQGEGQGNGIGVLPSAETIIQEESSQRNNQDTQTDASASTASSEEEEEGPQEIIDLDEIRVPMSYSAGFLGNARIIRTTVIIAFAMIMLLLVFLLTRKKREKKDGK